MLNLFIHSCFRLIMKKSVFNKQFLASFAITVAIMLSVILIATPRATISGAVTSSACVDTDGGQNPSSRGNILMNGNLIGSDVCKKSNGEEVSETPIASGSLVELYCEPDGSMYNYKYFEVGAGHQCKDGAIVKVTTTGTGTQTQSGAGTTQGAVDPLFDIDGDGIPNDKDSNTDGDAFDNVADDDDDNDGLLDAFEIENGLDPFYPDPNEGSNWCGLSGSKLKAYLDAPPKNNRAPTVDIKYTQQGSKISLDLRGSKDSNAGDRVKRLIVFYDYLGSCKYKSFTRAAYLDLLKDLISTYGETIAPSTEEGEDAALVESPFDAKVILKQEDFFFDHEYKVPQGVKDYKVTVAVFALDNIANQYYCADNTGIGMNCVEIDLVKSENATTTRPPITSKDDTDNDGITDDLDVCPAEFASPTKDADRNGCVDSSTTDDYSGYQPQQSTSTTSTKTQKSGFSTTLLIIIIIIAVIGLLLLYLYKQGKLPFGGGRPEGGSEGGSSSGGEGGYFE